MPLSSNLDISGISSHRFIVLSKNVTSNWEQLLGAFGFGDEFKLPLFWTDWTQWTDWTGPIRPTTHKRVRDEQADSKLSLAQTDSGNGTNAPILNLDMWHPPQF
jgi:hypothetical protein